jgi:hypothetical protein
MKIAYMKFAFICVAIVSCFVLPLGALDDKAIIEATISAVPAQAPTQEREKIQPGSTMLLKIALKNVGSVPSAPGEIFVRFAFPKPLVNHPQSILYESEKIALPSLLPGNETIISFTKPHTWQTVFDFVRDDWGMRSYQAIVNINGEEKIIATMPISFSAYYYAGPNSQSPIQVPSATH